MKGQMAPTKFWYKVKLTDEQLVRLPLSRTGIWLFSQVQRNFHLHEVHQAVVSLLRWSYCGSSPNICDRYQDTHFHEYQYKVLLRMAYSSEPHFVMNTWRRHRPHLLARFATSYINSMWSCSRTTGTWLLSALWVTHQSCLAKVRYS